MPFNKKYILSKNVENHLCLKHLRNATFEKQITSPWLSPGFVLTVSVTLKIERTAKGYKFICPIFRTDKVVFIMGLKS